MNPSRSSPGSCVIPSSTLSQRMLEERNTSRWALPLSSAHSSAINVSTASARTTLLLLWQQLDGIYQGPRSFMQETTHIDEI